METIIQLASILENNQKNERNRQKLCPHLTNQFNASHSAIDFQLICFQCGHHYDVQQLILNLTNQDGVRLAQAYAAYLEQGGMEGAQKLLIRINTMFQEEPPLYVTLKLVELEQFVDLVGGFLSLFVPLVSQSRYTHENPRIALLLNRYFQSMLAKLKDVSEDTREEEGCKEIVEEFYRLINDYAQNSPPLPELVKNILSKYHNSFNFVSFGRLNFDKFKVDCNRENIYDQFREFSHAIKCLRKQVGPFSLHFDIMLSFLTIHFYLHKVTRYEQISSLHNSMDVDVAYSDNLPAHKLVVSSIIYLFLRLVVGVYDTPSLSHVVIHHFIRTCESIFCTKLDSQHKRIKFKWNNIQKELTGLRNGDVKFTKDFAQMLAEFNENYMKPYLSDILGYLNL